mmetsp:Transcript_11420/g.13093  ORF Transcript_11420/g.13093 Transcript_11420/m.13093 type:complete len:231 (+) Transcript_11420:92-784(+)
MAALPALDTLTQKASLGKFNGFMSLRSYINGYEPTSADVTVFEAFKGECPNPKIAVHGARWYNHIAQFSADVRSSWPKADLPSGAPAKKKAPAKKEEEEDDMFGDDDDLFADDDGEAAAALKAKLTAEAKARGEKKLEKGRSMIVFEVKPYEADQDLEALAQGIKSITHEGIQNWGQEHKLVPVAFGIKKLVISVIVFDMKVGQDDIIDMINNKYEDDIQSIDVQAMSKV